MSKLFFSRYSIATGDQINDKFDFLLDGLKNEAKVNSRGYVYGFFDTEVFKNNEQEYIAGHLVKYSPDEMSEVVDEITKEIRDETLKNKVIGKARFIIDPSASILMFFEVTNIITSKSFIEKFCKLFIENHEGFFTEFNISPIKEQYSFNEKIKQFRSIKKITITLFPSNPRFADRWQSIDERLRNNHISKYKEIQENFKFDSNIVVDEETENKFLMSEDGYGESSAKGINEDGFERTISTKDSDRVISKEVPNNTDKALDILFVVSDTLDEIIKRTTK